MHNEKNNYPQCDHESPIPDENPGKLKIKATMELVILRFPHLAKNIFEQVDNRSKANCAESSKSWWEFLNEEGILQKSMIQAYTKCSRGYLREILQTTSLETLAFEVRNFFKLTHVRSACVRCEKHYLMPGLLMLAAEHGYLGVYKLIAEKCDNKNPNIYGFGHPVLHEAIERFAADYYSLKRNMVSNPETVAGLTPLHYAAKNGHLEVYRFILEHLTDKIPGDMYGLTPLHFAAMRGQLEMCKLILEMVDNKNPRTPHALYGKWTPLDWAEENGHFEVCRLITSAIGKYFLRPKRLKIYK